jgi:hypothetical protein
MMSSNVKGDQVKKDEMHVTRVGEMRNAYRILVDRPEGRDHSEDLGVDVRMILNSILGKCSFLLFWCGMHSFDSG